MRTRPNFGIIGQASPTLATTGIVKTLADYNATTVISTAQTNTVAIGNTAAGGSSITYYGDYRIHTFTGSGTFTAQHTGFIEYLLIAGGGGGGYNAQVGGITQAYRSHGAGGAGGFLEHYATSIPGNDFQGPRMFVNAGDNITVTVGGGGPASNDLNVLVESGDRTYCGNDTTIKNTASNQMIAAIGGGAGGIAGTVYDSDPGYTAGFSGGSGGGTGSGLINTGAAWVSVVGRGGDPILNPRQGYPGHGSADASGNYGGGAGGQNGGVNRGSGLGYTGGSGRASSITGVSVTYSEGGGIKGSSLTTDFSSPANSGKGGDRGYTNSNTGVNGSLRTGQSGGSGIVIIRYRFQ